MLFEGKLKIICATVFLVGVCYLTACKHNEVSPNTPYEINTGKIRILTDVNYKQLTDELIKSYENVYDSADIVPNYVPEEQVIKQFMQDSVQLIIIGRKLNTAEIKNSTIAQEIAPREHIIAFDAIAVVTAAGLKDTVFDLDAFIANRNGGVKNKYSDTKFIFSNSQSGTLAYLFEKTGLKNPSTENMFALDSLEAFISYLQTNSNAIGFLPYALISDKDDPTVKRTLEQIQLLYVVHTDTSGTRLVSELSQSTIATKEYPLVRPINLVLGNAPERIGTGFVNFMYKSKPERIFLKAGLIPAQMPERQIKVNTN